MVFKRLGLIVNPLAGIGGRVGLKGSDGAQVQQQALALGAVPLSGERAAQALELLRPLAADFSLLTAPGGMGEEIARRVGLEARVIPLDGLPGRPSTPEDTILAARAMLEAGVDLLLFSGGDGTARDIYTAVRDRMPVLGIPSGVKIHSAVFGISPRCSGELAANLIQGKRLRLQDAEVVDVDEAMYRQGQIVTRLYGIMQIPYRQALVQSQKVPTPSGQSAQAQAVAADVIERMKPDLAYLLGPGTTTRAVAESLGLPKALIGVDILTRKELVASDVSERQILQVMDHRPLGMILTPTGGQGFLLGRGNQPISPEVIRRVERKQFLVVCLPSKIAALQGRPFLVDTGSAEVDGLLAGYVRVITGYHESSVYKIVSP